MKISRKLSLLIIFITIFSSLLPFASAQNSKRPFKAIGASNTVGLGASFPLEVRYAYHLISESQKSAENKVLLKNIEAQNILIALDYFYFTNYTKMDIANVNHSAEIDKLIQAWSQDSQVIIFHVT